MMSESEVFWSLVAAWLGGVLVFAPTPGRRRSERQEERDEEGLTQAREGASTGVTQAPQNGPAESDLVAEKEPPWPRLHRPIVPSLGSPSARRQAKGREPSVETKGDSR